MSKADELLAEIDAAVDELERCRRRIGAMDHARVQQHLQGVSQPELFLSLLDDGDDAAKRVARALCEYHKERTT